MFILHLPFHDVLSAFQLCRAGAAAVLAGVPPSTQIQTHQWNGRHLLVSWPGGPNGPDGQGGLCPETRVHQNRTV